MKHKFFRIHYSLELLTVFLNIGIGSTKRYKVLSKTNDQSKQTPFGRVHRTSAHHTSSFFTKTTTQHKTQQTTMNFWPAAHPYARPYYPMQRQISARPAE